MFLEDERCTSTVKLRRKAESRNVHSWAAILATVQVSSLTIELSRLKVTGVETALETLVNELVMVSKLQAGGDCTALATARTASARIARKTCVISKVTIAN